jgi:hypothetical protein
MPHLAGKVCFENALRLGTGERFTNYSLDLLLVIRTNALGAMPPRTD